MSTLVSATVNDLIGRDVTITYSAQARASVDGKRFLVTGAGGSIGSEIVRQLVSLGAGAVYMLDHDEGALHALQLELRGHGLLQDDTVLLADIRDGRTLRRIFAEVAPTTVFHAAAHKHLPLLERFPAEAVRTNVLGTANTVRAAAAAGVRRFVNVSTDKAAAPVCVLGATKRVAEVVTAREAKPGTAVASVRFGNVLGSRGSLLPTLHWQLTHGVPVTVTDRAATRFFMTIPEASSLVIEASAMASTGETYVLDMGTPVSIQGLVNRYARHLGVPAPRIEYTGLRPGEKLHEELSDGAETRGSTEHERIWRMTSTAPCPTDFPARLQRLGHAAASGRDHAIRAHLWSLLPVGSAARAVTAAA
ncbi:polysaccharide biosynthesis protein [Asanoa siamensis]|uniref:Polysaccharide biosynthesis protein CapD-like domain-containing protein n=1 Tax=Asanoa siamensis TaxID=926357 RepID=A0ABQ4CMX4_9ACTN|nr:polysaccharide biosynthesis protein [Asanoa siamensis]GIF72647.1 hypothetical protein Asi02nite_21650 [Asanoa siamensis]